MIPQDHKGDLITTGIQFIRAICTAYGSEQGMEMWEAMSAAIDPELKGQIFFAMLTGEYEGSIFFKGINRSAGVQYLKINAIKQVRALSGMGLVEAKQFVEKIEAGGTASLDCPAKDRVEVVKFFRECGMIVS
jgi:hypothetical protein